MAEAKPETVKVTFIRNVDYKNVQFKAGATADVAPVTAERLIAAGHAEPAKAEKKAEK
jgi:hypothetical protein